MDITQPTLLLHEARCRQNIKNMAARAEQAGVKLQPHFKTHQSHQVGNWYKEEKVEAITVSSVQMARYFAQSGWKQITIAFPFNVLEIDQIVELSKTCDLTLLVNDLETMQVLGKHIETPVNYLVEINSGSNRSGLDSSDLQSIEPLMQPHQKLHFKGFYSHAGHTYNARGEEQIRDMASKALDKVLDLKKQFARPELKVYWGDTPSCSVMESFPGVDVITCGNFAFYDLMQEQIGSCTLDDIAVAVACPVVQKKPKDKELIIYGGAIHFSKDSIEKNGKRIFGKAVDLDSDNWSPINGELVKVSQEHGVLKVADEVFEKYKVGSIVGILPVHSCLTAQALGQYRTLNHHLLDHMAGQTIG